MAKIRIVANLDDSPPTIGATDHETGETIYVESINLKLDTRFPNQRWVRIGFHQLGHLDVIMTDPEYCLECPRCAGSMTVKKTKMSFKMAFKDIEDNE